MESPDVLQWIEIDADALRHNLRAFRAFLQPSTKLLPVIKANAYGHGMVDIAKLLRLEQVWGFAVAGAREADTLQRAGIRTNTLVLSYYARRDIERLQFPKDIACVVANKEQLALLRSCSRKRGVRFRAHVKIDTGTSRIGFLPSQLPAIARSLRRASDQLIVEGVFSHLAEAESAHQGFTRTQVAVFQRCSETLEHILQKKLVKHIACSAAILMEHSTHFDIARLGIGLYGIWPSRAVERFARRHFPHRELRSVLSWKTRLLSVKSVPAGTSVGYARMFRARRRLRYGILPVGYADGYFRSLSNKGAVLVRGKRCRVIGRVCMNLTMIDLTNVPNAATGDVVVLIGRQGEEVMSANEVAKQSSTISYEFLARLPNTIQRFVV